MFLLSLRDSQFLYFFRGPYTLDSNAKDTTSKLNLTVVQTLKIVLIDMVGAANGYHYYQK